MKETKCMCSRTIPKEEHTGLCQLDHFISYTGNGEHGVDSNELQRIREVIASDFKEAQNSTSHNTTKAEIAFLESLLSVGEGEAFDIVNSLVNSKIRERIAQLSAIC